MHRPGSWLLLIGLLVVALLAGLAIGAVALDPTDVLRALTGRAEGTAGAIVLDLRMPRVLLAALVGAGLAASGAAYQGLFQNPLADPFVIGASSGAALGAALAILAGLGAVSAGLGVPISAFLGTAVAVALVWLLGGVGAQASPLTLLLAGAAVSTVFGALVSLLMLVHDRGLAVIFVWLMGGFGGRGWPDVALAALWVLPGLAALRLLARPLDALVLGDESAAGLGLPMRRVRLVIVLVASAVTAATVAVAGIIGFVGLVAPHAARALVGARHAAVIPASALLGAILLIAADLVARTVFAPVEIPVGIMTALVGGPFFLWVLRRPSGGNR